LPYSYVTLAMAHSDTSVISASSGRTKAFLSAAVRFGDSQPRNLLDVASHTGIRHAFLPRLERSSDAPGQERTAARTCRQDRLLAEHLAARLPNSVRYVLSFGSTSASASIGGFTSFGAGKAVRASTSRVLFGPFPTLNAPFHTLNPLSTLPTLTICSHSCVVSAFLGSSAYSEPARHPR